MGATMPTFKLLRGRHAEGKDKNGKQIIYPRGSTFASDYELDKIHNKTNSVKFQRISDDKVENLPSTQQADIPNQDTVSDGLEDLTVNELKELAESEEIDLEGVNKKSEILNRIRSLMV